MATKSLGAKHNDVAREVLQRVLHARFNDDQTAMASAIGISQPFLSELLAGTKGVGGKTLAGLFMIDPGAASEIAAGRAGTMAPTKGPRQLDLEMPLPPISVDDDPAEEARALAAWKLHTADDVSPNDAAAAVKRVVLASGAKWIDYYFAAKKLLRAVARKRPETDNSFDAIEGEESKLADELTPPSSEPGLPKQDEDRRHDKGPTRVGRRTRETPR